MNIKTITSVDGVNTVDFGSAASRFYWFKNIGTTTVYVSGDPDISAGGDGVAELPSGGSVCIETLGGKVYVLGAGKVQIHNTGDKFCPFKSAPVSSGGGVSVEIGNRIDPKRTDTDISWEILANGSSSVNGGFNIIGYNIMPGSLIYVKAKNPEAKCKFVFQNIFSVTTSVPNTAMIGNPYTADYDGLIIVPENATWICFSQEKTDDVTGIYEIVGGV